MSKPSVAVVILNFNTAELLAKYLPFVLKSDYPNFEVIVADNGSSDGSGELVKRDFPDVRLISMDQNLGFAGGYNACLRELDHDYFVLLNSDVRVAPNWISPIIELLENDPRIAAAQPKILAENHPDHFEYAGASGGFIDNLAYPFCRGRLFDTLERDEGQYDSVKEIFWASGAALFIRRKQWEESGGLDTDFFAHMEEIDLCWRLKNLGYKIVAVPSAKVWHVGGATLSKGKSKKTFLNFRNTLACMAKNMPASQFWIKLIPKLFLDGLAGIRFLLQGKPNHCWAIMKAHFAFYANFRTWWNQRRKISPKPLSGVYRGNIVFAHFLQKKKTYQELESRISQ